MLRLALIANQHDRSLVDTWFHMLESEQNDVLPGTEYSGFYGVLAADLPGQPNLDDSGRALSAMVDYLTPRRGIRLKKLDELFRRIKEYHGSDARWDVYLIEVAHKNQWRQWAVNWLPRLWIGPNEAASLSEGAYAGKWIVSAPLSRTPVLLCPQEASSSRRHCVPRKKEGSDRDLRPQGLRTVSREKIGLIFEKARRDALVPGNERDERGDLAAHYASTRCLAMDWGDEASLIREVFRMARTDMSQDRFAAPSVAPSPSPCISENDPAGQFQVRRRSGSGGVSP